MSQSLSLVVYSQVTIEAPPPQLAWNNVASQTTLCNNIALALLLIYSEVSVCLVRVTTCRLFGGVQWNLICMISIRCKCWLYFMLLRVTQTELLALWHTLEWMTVCGSYYSSLVTYLVFGMINLRPHVWTMGKGWCPFHFRSNVMVIVQPTCDILPSYFL